MLHISRSLSRLALVTIVVGATFSPGPSATADQRGAGATCAGLAATIVGTPGPDDLAGTSGDDVIVGLGGRDTIDGGAGEDTICGGGDTDRLVGGDGDDRIYGQGNGRAPEDGQGYSDLIGDSLQGGPGSDLLNVGPVAGHDEDLFAAPEVFDFSDLTTRVRVDLVAGTAVDQGGDVDTLGSFGGVNHSRLVIGTSYDDVMLGTRDDDELSGGDGNDLLRGETGADTLRGGAGDDRLIGGRDHDGRRDPIEPTSGGDQLWAGPGADTLIPGGRDERYAVAADELHYDDVAHGIRLDLRSGTVAAEGIDRVVTSGAIQIFGSRFDDVLRGDRFTNVIYGLAGDDRLAGRAGSDELNGDDIFSRVLKGEDVLRGGRGLDYLDGGPLADLLVGGPGYDLDWDRPAGQNTCRGIERSIPKGC